ncbi:hypothetical protein ASD00_26880 [Ensifer sp. Root31]|nr:hypothetical protein ASD00_26880 [Ensifer sp. Root31]
MRFQAIAERRRTIVETELAFTLGARGSGGASGDAEVDDVRIRGEGLAPAPGGEMLPDRGIGLAGVGGTRSFGKVFERGREEGRSPLPPPSAPDHHQKAPCCQAEQRSFWVIFAVCAMIWAIPS